MPTVPAGLQDENAALRWRIRELEQEVGYWQERLRLDALYCTERAKALVEAGDKLRSRLLSRGILRFQDDEAWAKAKEGL